ncbi:multidrug transporter EmrE-like cation transporter [Bacillus mesophilus]|uniref:EamA family transporter n=1 Tax=Bacillus mesophilus TaxID=1808955 RepID=A0A6M0QBF5_9BACI|nr:EamA family transporter [Bacillus mesophilus]MBM7661686.1 multidrug transporter EmrE-like cation transporter [Bacillus mesophilus]NEY72348.1 EamA family transporter [Bacillus mesophilus]
MGYLYIAGTIFFTVYGQIVLKWRITKYGALPVEISEKILFIAKLFLDPFIISGFLSAFVASIFWILAMTKFQLSYAYPFMSLAFVLVFILSIFIFKEPVSSYKIIGLSFIVLGIIVTSKSL